MWELPVGPLLDGGPGTLALAPVSNVDETELPAVMQRLEERFREPALAPQAPDQWPAIVLLVGFRYPEEFVLKLFQGGTTMEESVTYQWIVSKSKLEEARKAVRIVGTSLYGQPSAEAEGVVNNITELDRLESLLARATKAKSWQELLGSAN